MLNCRRLDESKGRFLFDCGLDDFTGSGTIKAIPHDDVLGRLKLSVKLPAQKYTFTPHGIRTTLPVVPVSSCPPPYILERSSSDAPWSQWYLMILGCEHVDHPGGLLGRICYIPPSAAGVEYLHCGYMYILPKPNRGTRFPRLFPLSPATIERCRNVIQIKTVYISHPERTAARSKNARDEPHETINLMLRKATRDALRAQGYKAELRGPDEGHPTTHWLTLSNDDCTISIEYQHMLEEGWLLRIGADVKMSRRALDTGEDVEADPSSVRWKDSNPWYSSLSTKEVSFTLAGKKLALKLGFDWAALSHYFLRVEVVEVVEVVEMEEATPAVMLEWEVDEDHRYFRNQRRSRRARRHGRAPETPVVADLGADDNAHPGAPESDDIASQPEMQSGERTNGVD
ncbi:hypothetical protein DICSQDRAFT_171577 [Dichomitus squalens LYAD-421 SS1]|uniref:DUF8212 domain-containing protein n=1 Tax=Dichomitus squalens (strain LYAD-421) TaxID=732165 RepID=R7SUE5_DICSQ|nr:uncharacterized protein DICSQDRAFT_171577 [Dichomitus squalens LYAD-421 SS1]EJF59844.1 hypothetical protein DICSQDRAFT_171577 [Dichomitus squalens LYAD-421 SS1]